MISVAATASSRVTVLSCSAGKCSDILMKTKIGQCQR